MQKFLVMMMAFALTIGAQAQQDDGMDALLAAMIAAKIHQDSIDTSSLVAVYDYECKTQDADGKAVTDRMKVCLQVGQHCTRSYPYRKFREDTEVYECLAPDNLPLLRAESFCFMPEVWTNYPDGKVTVRDAIVPTPYETCEERKPVKWTLSDDTLTVGGYLCKTATCQLHGRKWTVRYSEDIPTSAGPWKLCGLPGLVLEAYSSPARGEVADRPEGREDGIHRFTIADIQRIASPIYYETNAITVKTTEAKLIKNRIRTFGNRLYLKNPKYYVGDLSTADVTHDTEGILVNNVYVNNKAHVFQPLELTEQ